MTAYRLVGMCTNGRIGSPQIRTSAARPHVGVWQVLLSDVHALHVTANQATFGGCPGRAISIELGSDIRVVIRVLYRWWSDRPPEETTDLLPEAQRIAQVVAEYQSVRDEWSTDGPDGRSFVFH